MKIKNSKRHSLTLPEAPLLIPSEATTPKDKVISVRLDCSVLDEIDVLAKRCGRSRNDLIKLLIRHSLNVANVVE